MNSLLNTILLLDGLMDFFLGTIGTLLIVNFILILAVMTQVRKLTRKKYHGIPAKEAKTTWWHLFDRKTTMPDQVMENHEYDGIKEYDNNPPAWFNWLFYLSIFWAVAYMLYYHVFKIGPLQEEEYANEMAEARIMFPETKADREIDYNKVEPLVEQAKIDLGQSIFSSNCANCHGPNGQGGIGPNLTDEYWIHGGDFSDIVRIIVTGVPEKGMLAWEKTLKTEEILQVSSYIHSIRGTNPPDPKAPQGDLYTGPYRGGETDMPQLEPEGENGDDEKIDNPIPEENLDTINTQ